MHAETPVRSRAAPPEGIWLPLITPFCDGRLDETTLAALVRRYLTPAVDGLILAATTGEGLTLEPDETERLAEIVAATVGSRVPVFLGLSGSNTSALRRTLARTRAWPIDGYLIACPYYTRPSQEGLRLHFTALADDSDKPIAVYNIPYRTGVNMSNETLLRLAELAPIVGVKDCCADPVQTFDLLRARPAGFSVMTGEDAQFFSAIAHGCDGGILASAHIDPEGFAATQIALIAGDRPRALRRWAELADVVKLLFAEPSPAPIKYWLWRQGLLPSAEVRLPMTPISDGLARRIDAAIERRRRSARDEFAMPAAAVDCPC
jgi:4-hydroxy-tetrahydrodipicolinate synthase